MNRAYFRLSIRFGSGIVDAAEQFPWRRPLPLPLGSTSVHRFAAEHSTLEEKRMTRYARVLACAVCALSLVGTIPVAAAQNGNDARIQADAQKQLNNKKFSGV